MAFIPLLLSIWIIGQGSRVYRPRHFHHPVQHKTGSRRRIHTGNQLGGAQHQLVVHFEQALAETNSGGHLVIDHHCRIVHQPGGDWGSEWTPRSRLSHIRKKAPGCPAQKKARPARCGRARPFRRAGGRLGKGNQVVSWLASWRGGKGAERGFVVHIVGTTLLRRPTHLAAITVAADAPGHVEPAR